MLKFLIPILFLAGCIGLQSQALPTQQEVISTVDVNSTTTTEKTYKIQNKETISVFDDGKKEKIQFDDDWFVVHKDLLKKMNENQDYIIKNLKKNKKTTMEFKLLLALVILLIVANVLKDIYGRR